MNNQEIIQNAYKSAVSGLKSEWFISDEDDWYKYIVSLPQQEKITYLIIVFNNEVYNGGFHQYFLNGYGQFAEETIPILKHIGAYLKAELLEIAFKNVNNQNFDSQTFRSKLFNKQIDSLLIEGELDDILGDLDEKYYATEGSEDLEKLLSDYLRSKSI